MPRILCAAYEVSNTWKILRCIEGGVPWVPQLNFFRFDSISLLLMVISSSMNFLIYCTGSEQFKVSFNFFLLYFSLNLLYSLLLFKQDTVPVSINGALDQ